MGTLTCMAVTNSTKAEHLSARADMQCGQHQQSNKTAASMDWPAVSQYRETDDVLH